MGHAIQSGYQIFLRRRFRDIQIECPTKFQPSEQTEKGQRVSLPGAL